MGIQTLVPVVITTRLPDILLRQLMPEDAEPLFECIDQNRKHLSQYGDETSVKYPTLESVSLSITNNPDPAKLRFGIWCGHKLIGCANLTPAKHLNSKSGQLGYWIGKEYEGRGIATSVAQALVGYAETCLHWRLIVGYVHKDNDGSKKVLYRAGLRFLCEEGDIQHYRARLST